MSFCPPSLRPALSIRHEPVVDFCQTAALASEGFEVPSGRFRTDRLKWLYEQAFSNGTDVLAAYAGDRKVGHIALVHQQFEVSGKVEAAVALIDLFILKAFRSRDAIGALYGAVEAFCRDRGIRFIIAVPNERAVGVNARFLGLEQIAVMDIRVGLSGMPRPWIGVSSYRVDDIGADHCRAVLSDYQTTPGGGLHWTTDMLWARLQKPDAGYAIHAGKSALLISAPRTTRGLPHALLCGFLVRPGASRHRSEIAALTASACRLHRTPLFVYVGMNRTLSPPGISLPKRLRPSQMILQLRDFRPSAAPIPFDRFEVLDFDLA